MSTTVQHEPNPLRRVALALPAGVGRLLSLASRIAGGALAVAIAVAQDYDRTRAFAVVLTVVALVSCLPLGGWLRERLPWLGAGVLFFGGALLAQVGLGRWVLLCGALAAVGAAIDEGQDRRQTRVAAFFTGFGLIVLAVAAIVLGIEG